MRDSSSNQNESRIKKAVMVGEMARMVELSRSRFGQLVKSGVFPSPVYDPRTGRRFYTQEQQRVILDLKASNCSVDGTPVLFYKKRKKDRASKAKTAQNDEKRNRDSKLVDQVVKGVSALGHKTNREQVGEVLVHLHPHGFAQIEIAELIKSAFLELRRDCRYPGSTSAG